MKKSVLKIVGLALFFLVYNLIQAYAQKHEESFNRMAKFSENAKKRVFVLENVNGHVTVEGYQGNDVKMEIDKRITGDSDSDVEEGKRDIKFVVEEKGDTIYVYIDSPYMMRKRHKGKSWWSWNNHHEVDYAFNFDIKVKAPSNIDLSVHTINHGDVKVKGIYAENLRASNVNGDVILEDITGKTKATTVNGVVKASYKENPPENSKYSTINGDITIHYRKNLSAHLGFKSMHGEFFTEFDVSGYLPSKVDKQHDKSGTVRFVVNKYTGVTVGKGDVSYKFETLNGNIYIKKH
ncbi:MAG: DUF4097 family beta strand repeat-containing protein [Flammeovirgaceae bacterium]